MRARRVEAPKPHGQHRKRAENPTESAARGRPVPARAREHEPQEQWPEPHEPNAIPPRQLKREQHEPRTEEETILKSFSPLGTTRRPIPEHEQQRREPKRALSFIEITERETAMLSMLAHGLLPGEIAAQMQKQFGVSRSQSDAIRKRMQLQLVDHDRDELPALRAKAIRRIQQHILQASEANCWSAVGNLERTLAQIQGTFEPVQVKVNVDVRVRDAVSKVLSEMDTTQLDALMTDGEEVLDALPALPPKSIEHAASCVQTPYDDAAE